MRVEPFSGKIVIVRGKKILQYFALLVDGRPSWTTSPFRAQYFDSYQRAFLVRQDIREMAARVGKEKA